MDTDSAAAFAKLFSIVIDLNSKIFVFWKLYFFVMFYFPFYLVLYH